MADDYKHEHPEPLGAALERYTPTAFEPNAPELSSLELKRVKRAAAAQEKAEARGRRHAEKEAKKAEKARWREEQKKKRQIEKQEKVDAHRRKEELRQIEKEHKRHQKAYVGGTMWGFDPSAGNARLTQNPTEGENGYTEAGWVGLSESVSAELQASNRSRGDTWGVEVGGPCNYGDICRDLKADRELSPRRKS